MPSSTGPVVCLVLLSLIFIHGILSQPEHEPSNGGDQVARPKQLGAVLSGDDYHTNIDLNNMLLAHRYDLIGGFAGGDDDNMPSFDSLASKLKPRNGYARDQYEARKRPNYQPIRATKEDKDYTIVMLPNNNDNDRRINQDFASKASLWASDFLRDLVASETQNRLPNLGQLSTTYIRHGSGDANNVPAPVGPNREKRRRCKVDPNMGVKNPSFCETDAFFGATEYGRDVWDSAGR